VQHLICETDYSVRPGASQGLVLSEFIQLIRLARRHGRTYFLHARVSLTSISFSSFHHSYCAYYKWGIGKKIKVKYFPSHLVHRSALISDSVTHSHTQAEDAKPSTRASVSHGVPVYLPGDADTKLYCLLT